ncbi:MAG TPA: 2'-5' RNA ligase family protein [Thermomicrobiales bacterium]|nr:2'-5' RNA ligase family protein [Thermomicrobiales bacterium]
MDKLGKASRRVVPGKEQFEVIGRSARHPLWWLPDPVANQEEAYRRIWQNLRTITEVRDGRHDDEQWHSHAGRFAMCCLRIPSSALTPAYADLQAALVQFPFVRKHPDSFLHVPIQEIGYLVDEPRQRDELTQTQLEEFIDLAERPLIDFPQFNIQLGPVNSFADAAFLDVHDNGWLSRIHRRLIDFATVPPSTRFAYVPHVTIAHYDRVAPVGNLAAVLTDWRDQVMGTFVAQHIDVVLLKTSETFPPFELAHSFPLGSTRATGEIPIRPTYGAENIDLHSG